MECSEPVLVAGKNARNAAFPHDDLFRRKFDARRSSRLAFEFLHVDDRKRAFGRVVFSFKTSEEERGVGVNLFDRFKVFVLIGEFQVRGDLSFRVREGAEVAIANEFVGDGAQFAHDVSRGVPRGRLLAPFVDERREVRGAAVILADVG